jgi:two-component system, cell cycle sensor histidine kinase and response regulator CckA
MDNRDGVSAAKNSVDPFLALALQQSDLPFVALRLDGGLIACNAAFRELTGYGEDELRAATSVLDLGSAEWCNGARRCAEAARQTRQPQRRDLELVRRDGTHVPVEVYLHCVRDQADRPQGYYASIIDITERKRLESQFLQAQKMDGIGRLAGGVAHDFNNMLTAIAAHATFLRDQQPAEHPFAEDIEQMLMTVERAAGLTRQLLALSREQVMAPQVLDLNALVLEMARMLQCLVGEEIELTARAALDLGRVCADPHQIEQVLLNLVINARDAMPHGGRILVELSNVSLKASRARQQMDVRPGQYVLLTVSDTGEGMTEEVCSRIFEPFFTTKEPGKGTGLGLAAVYGIVRQHDGQVRVQSEPGRGTTLEVYLPRVAYAEASSAAGPAREELPLSSPSNGETILLVEDEPSVRNVVARTLRKLGYDVLAAADGAESLRLAAECDRRVDLLLIDLVLPDVHGRELSEKLAAGRPKMRVLFISGYTQAAALEQGLLESGAAFLAKPFNRRALADKVRQVLDS